MYGLARVFLILLGLVLLVGLHLGLAYILPYPWSKINILFVVLILLLIWWHNGLLVWLTFFSHLFIELFTASPYGVVLSSATLSILLGYWCYQNLFTNRSWYAALALSGLTLLLYRLIYILLIAVLWIFKLLEFVPWQQIATIFFWEFWLTTGAVAVLYPIIARFSRRPNIRLVESALFRYEK